MCRTVVLVLVVVCTAALGSPVPWPTHKPTAAPTTNPTTAQPSTSPTSQPSTSIPTATPSDAPTANPTSASPTTMPTSAPSTSPTRTPTATGETYTPSTAPTTPTASPTVAPTLVGFTYTPTQAPSKAPTKMPTFAGFTYFPTYAPTTTPTTSTPTVGPTSAPTAAPTSAPTSTPTKGPTTTGYTYSPTHAPSSAPTTAVPTAAPSAAPTSVPTATPTSAPTSVPTTAPSTAPTDAPTTAVPTNAPTSVPTAAPTNVPTHAPTTAVPTAAPSAAPTSVPTSTPTAAPTRVPTAAPTGVPTTAMPTMAPTAPTPAPTTLEYAEDGVRRYGLLALDAAALHSYRTYDLAMLIPLLFPLGIVVLIAVPVATLGFAFVQQRPGPIFESVDCSGRITTLRCCVACGGSRAGAGTDTSGGAWLPADLLAGGVLLAEALFAFASMTQFGVIFLYRDYKGDLASCDWQGFVNGLYTFVQPAQLAFVAMCTLWASSRDAGRLPSWRCVAPTLLVLWVGSLILALFPLMGVGFYVFPKDYCTMDTEWYNGGRPMATIFLAHFTATQTLIWGSYALVLRRVACSSPLCTACRRAAEPKTGDAAAGGGSVNEPPPPHVTNVELDRVVGAFHIVLLTLPPLALLPWLPGIINTVVSMEHGVVLREGDAAAYDVQAMLVLMQGLVNPPLYAVLWRRFIINPFVTRFGGEPGLTHRENALLNMTSRLTSDVELAIRNGVIVELQRSRHASAQSGVVGILGEQELAKIKDAMVEECRAEVETEFVELRLALDELKSKKIAEEEAQTKEMTRLTRLIEVRDAYLATLKEHARDGTKVVAAKEQTASLMGPSGQGGKSSSSSSSEDDFWD